jgi:hypothetical protein
MAGVTHFHAHSPTLHSAVAGEYRMAEDRRLMQLLVAVAFLIALALLVVIIGVATVGSELGTIKSVHNPLFLSSRADSSPRGIRC